MILPFVFSKLCLDNNNRVKLLSEPGSAGSDYINASFVSVSICSERKGRHIISKHRFVEDWFLPFVNIFPPSRAIFAPMSSSPPRVLCQAPWLTFGGWSGKQEPAPSPCWLSVLRKAEWVFRNVPRPPSSAHERTSWATFAGSEQLWHQPRLLQRSEAPVCLWHFRFAVTSTGRKTTSQCQCLVTFSSQRCQRKSLMTGRSEL